MSAFVHIHPTAVLEYQEAIIPEKASDNSSGEVFISTTRMTIDPLIRFRFYSSGNMAALAGTRGKLTSFIKASTASAASRSGIAVCHVESSEVSAGFRSRPRRCAKWHSFKGERGKN